MNKVSDINLAVAVAKAGAIPSLSVCNYYDEHCWSDLLVKDLEQFRKELNHADLILALSCNILYEHYKELVDIISRYRIKHLELLDLETDDKFLFIEVLRKRGIKIIHKSILYPNDPVHSKVIKKIDAIILKSSEGAGKIVENANLKELILHCRENNPHLTIIACGGIATRNDVQNYLSIGANYVGIGTLFALSKESKIADNSKLSAIEKKRITKLKSWKLKQNTVLLDEKEPSYDNSTIFTINNTEGLVRSVNGYGGHLFCGEGIFHVNEILSVETIISRLT